MHPLSTERWFATLSNEGGQWHVVNWATEEETAHAIFEGEGDV